MTNSSGINFSDWWDAYRAKETFEGIPILKHLFAHAIKTYPNAKIFGFANADILFDESMVVTVENILRAYKEHNILITGRRTSAHVTLNSKIHDFMEVRKEANSLTSSLFTDGFAQDYVFITKDALPWERLPDFLVGREGYNAYLLTYALNAKLVTVDATNTILALHQTDKKGDYESTSAKLHNVNKDIIGPDFEFLLGRTQCAKYETCFTDDSQRNRTSIVIKKRKPNPCADLFQKYGLSD